MVGWLGNITWIRVDEMVEDEGKRIGLIGVWLISWGFAIKRVEEVQLVLPAKLRGIISGTTKAKSEGVSRIAGLHKGPRGEGRIDRSWISLRLDYSVIYKCGLNVSRLSCFKGHRVRENVLAYLWR